MARKVDWNDWNNFRNNAGCYQLLVAAEQSFKDIRNSLENFGNVLESDAVEILDSIKSLKAAYIAQCEARKKVEENKKGEDTPTTGPDAPL